MDNDTMVAVTPELLPCPSPWCNHRAYVASTDDDAFYGKAFQGRCTQCGMGGPVKRTESEAIAAWNHRHQSRAGEHPDLAGHIADAVRDACNIVIGKVVSFDDSGKIADTILDRIRGVNADYAAALSQSTAGEDGT